LPEDEEDPVTEITSEADIHSFIVRIWREEPTSKADQRIWRGHITPIPQGERVYFKDLDEIPQCITNLLKTLG
jgi:hypothetical protein